MYSKYCTLRDSLRMKDADVSKKSGVSRSTFTDWKNGRSTPKPDKIQKIADTLNVPISYFYEEPEEDSYYLDPETQALAEELRNNQELKALFDVARDMPKERLEAIYNLLKNM